MARLSRIAVPQIPYHITQRGNRRQPVFFGDDDYRTYLQCLQEASLRWGLTIWAYCLMTNHVHLIVVPNSDQSLARGLGETHRRYTRFINFREGWRGYLWQGRFASVPLDEPHLMAALRYVEHNPVAAKLVRHAEDYPWSSAKAHVTGQPDALLSPHPLREQLRDWAAFLASAEDPTTTQHLEEQLRTGRPEAAPGFVQRLEQQLGRRLRRRVPGPPPGVLK